MRKSEYAYICKTCGEWVHIDNRSHHDMRDTARGIFHAARQERLEYLLRSLEETYAPQ